MALFCADIDHEKWVSDGEPHQLLSLPNEGKGCPVEGVRILLHGVEHRLAERLGFVRLLLELTIKLVHQSGVWVAKLRQSAK